MGDDLDVPRFDQFVPTVVDGHSKIMVVHRDVDLEPYAWHSPLERGPVGCSLCETPGTRVYLVTEEPD